MERKIDDFTIPTMLTIKETANRTGLAAYYIRQLVLKNEIYYIRCGSKYLVNLERLEAYLDAKQQESIKTTA
ncbi:MAG: excisionase family DNA-binding protein [Lachnospiraceae bacterium]|nr:excisionase family DNA-binding protein [Lachnospiraceae bacterium]